MLSEWKTGSRVAYRNGLRRFKWKALRLNLSSLEHCTNKDHGRTESTGTLSFFLFDVHCINYPVFINGFLDVVGPEDPSAAVATALYQQDETESIEGPWLQLPADFFSPKK